MTPESEHVLNAIEQLPRVDILDGPTPLIKLNQISDKLDVDLWMKRDDLAGPSFGGNKARQLEYYFGAAVAQDADTILITGAVQSNFVRLAAAVAVRYGMKAIIQLEQRVSTEDPLYHQSGNVLLNQILGAEIIAYPVGEDEKGADDALYAKVDALRAACRKPYVIPLGENKPPLGACGYVQAAAELKEQMPEPFDTVIVASGSAATHIGTVAGMKIFSPPHRSSAPVFAATEPCRKDGWPIFGRSSMILLGVRISLPVMTSTSGMMHLPRDTANWGRLHAMP